MGNSLDAKKKHNFINKTKNPHTITGIDFKIIFIIFNIVFCIDLISMSDFLGELVKWWKQ